MKEYLEAFEKELNLLQQQKNNLLHKQARAKTDNEIKYWQFRIDKFNEKISAFTNIKQRLEAIDNANPSEAMDRLEYICKILHEKFIVDIKWVFKNEYNIIKQALIKAQEQEKVIKILFEKEVDIWYLKECFEDEYGSGKYNNRVGYKHSLTQEEFDTLKRYFNG